MTGQPRFKRNEPCPCGSGVVYKFCHQAVLEAPDDSVLQAGHEQYVRAWGANSGHYEARGYYSDLAREVQERAPRRILDVGCGLGQGLNAVVMGMPPGEKFLIGLDENPLCLDEAAELLAVNGIKAKVIKRMINAPVPGERFYDLDYELGKLAIDSEVTLIQSDVMEDDELEVFLLDFPPFDALTLWFSGTHTARQGMRRLAGLDYRRLAGLDYTKQSQRDGVEQDQREGIESQVFKLASRLLRPGGFVHLADRACSGDFNALAPERRDKIQSIAGAGFEVLPPSVRSYTEPTNSSRIGLVWRGKVVPSDSDELGILSTIAVKHE